QGPTEPQAPAEPTGYDSPNLLSRTIGRAEFAEALFAQLPNHRLVTIVGPGGIGKTTIAIAVADRLRTTYPQGIRFVDLAPVVDPQLVPSVLASAMGAPIFSESPISALTARLRSKRMLLVVDSCEHVIEAVPTLAEELLKAAPEVHILATSREPLRAE